MSGWDLQSLNDYNYKVIQHGHIYETIAITDAGGKDTKSVFRKKSFCTLGWYILGSSLHFQGISIINQ